MVSIMYGVSVALHVWLFDDGGRMRTGTYTCGADDGGRMTMDTYTCGADDGGP